MNRRGFFRALASAPFLSVAVPVAALGASFNTGNEGLPMMPATPAEIGKISIMWPPLMLPPYVILEDGVTIVHVADFSPT